MPSACHQPHNVRSTDSSRPLPAANISQPANNSHEILTEEALLSFQHQRQHFSTSAFANDLESSCTDDTWPVSVSPSRNDYKHSHWKTVLDGHRLPAQDSIHIPILASSISSSTQYRPWLYITAVYKALFWASSRGREVSTSQWQHGVANGHALQCSCISSYSRLCRGLLRSCSRQGQMLMV